MNAVRDLGSGALAVVRRDLRIALSYRFRFVGGILTAFFSLTLFYYVSRLVRVEQFASPDDYYGFVVAGLVILQVLQATLITPSATVRTELVAGTFERLALSPYGAVRAIAAAMLFPLPLRARHERRDAHLRRDRVRAATRVAYRAARDPGLRARRPRIRAVRPPAGGGRPGLP